MILVLVFASQNSVVKDEYGAKVGAFRSMEIQVRRKVVVKVFCRCVFLASCSLTAFAVRTGCAAKAPIHDKYAPTLHLHWYLSITDLLFRTIASLCLSPGPIRLSDLRVYSITLHSHRFYQVLLSNFGFQ